MESEEKISLESIKQPFWALAPEEAVSALKSGAKGISNEEAAVRRKIFGANEIKEKKRLTKLKIILNQLKSPLILALVAAGAVTIALKEWIDTAVIFAAVIANTALGFYQENKAENSLALLKTYIRTRARAQRAGKEREIDASELVPGDVIRVSQGDRVPADARLIFANNLGVDEAVLTGESLPESKSVETVSPNTPLAERKSMIFSGTLAVEGFADAVVVATGSDTEFGKIAALVSVSKEEPTPLQREISAFVAKAGGVLAVLVLSLFGLGLYFGQNLNDMFLISVAVAVAAVPEGLPIAVTVILAAGVVRLANRKGVVRKLLAAETLGSTSVILTDKTGTLTKAQMELAEIRPYEKSRENKTGLLEKALINLDVVIENPEENPENWKIFGKALEISLVRGAAKAGVQYPHVLKNTTFADRLPFSSEYKFSATVSEHNSKFQLIMLGAPEILLYYTDIEDDEKKGILAEIDDLALAGHRIVGVAFKNLDSSEYKIPKKRTFESLKFGGLIAFRDPLRPGVAGAIKHIADAGVKTIIVTGDHQGTAEAVARELGLVDGKGAILTGDDLKHLSHDELKNRADQVSVYARVTPEEKLAITKIYQERGEVVAVTGDGVNDAPALEAADIGVAVGSGTDVTKSAADLVILDDNFETIVAAVEEGKRILANMRKVIVYLLSTSLDELLLIGCALIASIPLPLNALQILLVNFFSDSFPAVAFAFEKENELANSKPKDHLRSIFDREVKFLILVIGILTSFLLFAIYFFMLRLDFPENLTRTFIFASFATYGLLASFALRNLQKSIFRLNPFKNKYLLGGVGIGIVLTALAVYLPFFQSVFGTVPLPPIWLAGVAGVGMFNLLLVEFSKWLFKKHIL